jgi:hypothetical protein
MVQPKRKKRLFSESGDAIPVDDKDAIQDMSGGKRIVYYREDKAEENKDKVVSIGKYWKLHWIGFDFK